jgi:membrane-bound ClpP family serine protease
MTPVTLAILLFAGGLVFLIAEIFLPSHGVLGLAGLLSLFVGVGTCFFISNTIGLASAIGVVLLLPVMAGLALKVWPHTFAGRRLILGRTLSAQATSPHVPVQIGQMGIVVSELRPGGVCEFGMMRVESRAEHGVIPAGRHVEVVSVIDGRPLVRAV